MFHRRKAFTLIELLVVVAIISLLISILLPSLGAARAQTRTAICTSNLRQLCIAWTSYGSENKDSLPGGSNDYFNRNTHSTVHPGYPVNYRVWNTLDWLGTVGESGDQLNDVPRAGSVFKYAGENPGVYKCPEDMIDRAETLAGPAVNGTNYSYTSPTMITGIKGFMLTRTMWAQDYPLTRNPLTQWDRNLKSGLPWLMVEEDEAVSLADVTDSAWGNEDRLTQRHRGERASVGHLDGHVVARKFQANMTAHHTYYELTDGRVVSNGPYLDTRSQQIKWGYLKGKYVAGIVRR